LRFLANPRLKNLRKPQKGTHPPTCQRRRNPKEAPTHPPASQQPAGQPPEGPPNFFPADPLVHLLYPRPTHPPADFFLGSFSKVLGVLSVRGVQLHYEHFFQSPFENFFKKIGKYFDVSFSSTFLFCRLFGCFSAMGVQKHYKKRFATKSCRKVFAKKSK
jgi:hypothetical protein